jgi:hypothetical protein
MANGLGKVVDRCPSPPIAANPSVQGTANAALSPDSMHLMAA